jgi:hypothetical protein
VEIVLKEENVRNVPEATALKEVIVLNAAHVLIVMTLTKHVSLLLLENATV